MTDEQLVSEGIGVDLHHGEYWIGDITDEWAERGIAFTVYSSSSTGWVMHMVEPARIDEARKIVSKHRRPAPEPMTEYHLRVELVADAPEDRWELHVFSVFVAADSEQEALAKGDQAIVDWRKAHNMHDPCRFFFDLAERFKAPRPTENFDALHASMRREHQPGVGRVK
jgi:hypothetical protein